jgi:hypothetical protein
MNQQSAQIFLQILQQVENLLNGNIQRRKPVHRKSAVQDRVQTAMLTAGAALRKSCADSD